VNDARFRNYRVGTHYAIGAVLLVIAAFLLKPWGLLLLWPAIAGALVSLAYLRVGVRVFRKTGGRLPFSTRVVFAPYLIIARLMHHHFNRRSEPYCQIAPGVWVGGRLKPTQAQELLSRGITAVLDLTAECSESPPLLQVRYLNLPLLDLTPPTVAEVHTAVEFIREHRETGGVYVHCALGVSRSVCIVAAYMLYAEQQRTVDQAYSIIRDARSVAVLKSPARRTLEAYRASLAQQ
jgi:protein-tyrosine phosphatase